MKTPQTVIRTSIGLFVSGLIATAALAGPGPQYWNRPAPKPAPVKMEEHPTGKCDGCKTTPIWLIGDRGPAGKGAPGARVTGYSHSCTGCVGKNTTENGKINAGMKHAPACGILVCCK